VHNTVAGRSCIAEVNASTCGCTFFVLLLQVDVTSKTEGKVDNSHMLVKYDARLRDNVAAGVVAEVTDTVQVRLIGQMAGERR
jgi:hypothetical protein